METFDVVVIGAGPGGYPAAIRAAQLGASVAIVEKEFHGGTCLNWGCIPTKAMIAAADLYHHIKHAGQFGIEVKGVSVNFAGLVAHKNKVVQQLRGGIGSLLTGNGVKQFAGTASFVDRNTIEVAGQRIGAKKVIISTGSTSVMPGFLPKSPKIVESRKFLELEKLPATLIVMGGGYIGCELACMAAQLGVKVTIVELLDDVLLLLDADVRREVRMHMEKNLGITIRTGKPLEKAEAEAAEMVLVAVGRKPVTDGLKLEAAGVKTNEKGFVPVDDFGRTNVANIYAIGDVTGRTQLAHYATSQGIIAAENAVGQKPSKHESLVPGVIFTSPEVALVGLTEDEAKKQGREIITGKFRLGGLGRAIAVAETGGFVKWIADAKTDQLLGAAVVGAHATELIAEAALAIRSELTASELGRTVHAHPTFAESWMEAAHAVHGTCVHAPPKRKK
ncbi:MAG: Dihydrolipoyl dehydrogenase [Verrucomicrobiae bacterium]|nr:Dihydrolipoyl dehydrogenase [Verrucomicrobiae bacterium]